MLWRKYTWVRRLVVVRMAGDVFCWVRGSWKLDQGTFEQRTNGMRSEPCGSVGSRCLWESQQGPVAEAGWSSDKRLVRVEMSELGWGWWDEATMAREALWWGADRKWWEEGKRLEYLWEAVLRMCSNSHLKGSLPVVWVMDSCVRGHRQPSWKALLVYYPTEDGSGEEAVEEREVIGFGVNTVFRWS